MEEKISLIYTTVSTQTEAEKLAASVVTEKLAICANIIAGGRSIYLWEGHLENAEEHYIFFKTLSSLADALKKHLMAHHPYEVPAILTIPAEASAPFAAYMKAGLKA